LKQRGTPVRRGGGFTPAVLGAQYLAEKPFDQ